MTRYDTVAEAFGCHGEHVEQPDDIAPAITPSRASGKPSIVNVVVAPSVTAPAPGFWLLAGRSCHGQDVARGRYAEGVADAVDGGGTDGTRASQWTRGLSRPLPLIVEVWPQRTGGFDSTVKVRESWQGGDAGIRLLHPVERMLTVYLKQPDESFTEGRYQGGHIRPSALPGVTIDLDEVFSL